MPTDLPGGEMTMYEPPSQSIEEQTDLGELLRLALMVALRENKRMSAYFLEMALLDCEEERDE